VKLRYRAGYYGIDRMEFERSHPDQRRIDIVGALNADHPTAMGLQFQASVVAPTASQTKTAINFAIDPAPISFQAGSDGLQHAQVTCAVRAFVQGDIEHPKQTEATRVNPAIKPEVLDQIRKTYFPCRIEIDLPPGQYLLRLLVRDDSTGVIGTVNARETVEKNQAAAEAAKP